MILQSKQFKDLANTILSATDNSELSTLTETLELKTVGKILYLNVTNRNYFCSAKIDLDHEEAFHSTVNATQFLKLIANVTSSEIELVGHDTYLAVKANGTYKLPYIFEGEKLLELPEIIIENKTVEMNIPGDSLNSILLFNSKELVKASIAQPVQKLYYLDQEGCITFTSGACVNSFTLEKPIQLLIDNRLVKLFKLFKNSLVRFTLGYDSVDDLIQTKVCFETEHIKLTAITPSDDSLLAKVPVTKIRSLASKSYPCKIVLNKEAFLQAVNRLALFSVNDVIDVSTTETSIKLKSGESEEILNPENGSVAQEPYNFLINLTNLKAVLESCTEQYITMDYGDHTAVVLTRSAVRNIIPESIRR